MSTLTHVCLCACLFCVFDFQLSGLRSRSTVLVVVVGCIACT